MLASTLVPIAPIPSTIILYTPFPQELVELRTLLSLAWVRPKIGQIWADFGQIGADFNVTDVDQTWAEFNQL